MKKKHILILAMSGVIGSTKTVTGVSSDTSVTVFKQLATVGDWSYWAHEISAGFNVVVEAVCKKAPIITIKT